MTWNHTGMVDACPRFAFWSIAFWIDVAVVSSIWRVAQERLWGFSANTAVAESRIAAQTSIRFIVSSGSVVRADVNPKRRMIVRHPSLHEAPRTKARAGHP